MNATKQNFKRLGSHPRVWRVNVYLAVIFVASVWRSAAWADAPGTEPQVSMAVRVIEKTDVESLKILAFMDRKFKDLLSMHGWVMIGVWRSDENDDIADSFPGGTEWVEVRESKEGRKKLAPDLALVLGIDRIYETGGAKVRDLHLRALVGVEGNPGLEDKRTKCSLMEGLGASFIFVDKSRVLLVSLK
jgi:hypothetical protein